MSITENEIRSSIIVNFTLLEIMKMNQIFSKFNLNRMDYQIHIKEIQEKKFDFRRKMKIKNTECPIIDINVTSCVFKEYEMAQTIVDFKIYTLDHEDRLWMIHISTDVFVPIYFNNTKDLADMGMYLLKGFLCKNTSLQKKFKYFPTLSTMFSYEYSNKKMNEETIVQTVRSYSLEDEI